MKSVWEGDAQCRRRSGVSILLRGGGAVTTVMKRGMRSEASVSGEEVQRECVMRGRDAGSIM